jgi:hypothetical protein
LYYNYTVIGYAVFAVYGIFVVKEETQDEYCPLGCAGIVGPGISDVWFYEDF